MLSPLPVAGKAAAAFVAEQVDAVGAFPPFWLTALERKGSKELISSKDFPGAIPDLLVVSQKLIDEQPEKVQALINTWYDTLDFIEKNPKEAEAIMAERAGFSADAYEKFKDGTRIFSVEDNLEAFSQGDNMKHMPYAAQSMAKFMVDVGFMKQEDVPDLEKIFDDRFVKAYAEKQQ